MRSVAILSTALALGLAVPAFTQERDEDQLRVCPLLTPELAQRAAAESKGKGQCQVVCSGCGCKGGPGYRGPKGCVGWADLIRTCGPSPHAGCSRECAPVRPGCSNGRVWLKGFAAALGVPVTFVEAEPRGADAGAPANANRP